MTFSRNIVIKVALDSFKSDKQVLILHHCGLNFKELNVSYFDEGMGSKGRESPTPVINLTVMLNSFLTEVETIVVLIESMINKVCF